MLKIPCVLFRAGTSKGPFFLKSDLPDNPALRDKALLRLMGSPDPRQIDGIGGGTSLTSKAAIVSLSDRDDADINYFFCQVRVIEAIVETKLNCGNMLSAVAPFAIMKGLVKATDPETTVRIYNENTGVIVLATVQTPNGEVRYSGDAHIDGVPGTAAPIKLSFLNPVGAKTGKLLPTGAVVDDIDGIPVSCVDVTVPMVITYAEALGKTGYESKEELDADKEFLKRLEHLREQAALKMGLGDVSHSISPKICIVALPKVGGTIRSCYFTPFRCHPAYAVSGASCLAAACLIPGTTANNRTQLKMPNSTNAEQQVVIEHVSGHIDISVQIASQADGSLSFPMISSIRTVRPLFIGEVLIPDLQDK